MSSTKKRDQKQSIKGLAASPSTSRRASLDETKRVKKSRAESLDSHTGPITRSRGNSMAEESPALKERKERKQAKKEKKASKKANIVEESSDSETEKRTRKKAKVTEESKLSEDENEDDPLHGCKMILPLGKQKELELEQHAPVKKDFMTNATFESLDIDAMTKKSLREHMKYDLMTAVQQESLPIALTGKDMLAQAKTGTGKTIAFLLPTIQKLVDLRNSGMAGRGRQNPGCSALIISPTRELAIQIGKEAENLMYFHQFNVATLVGGTSKYQDRQKIWNGVDLLVCTPGRLEDHLNDTKGFADMIWTTKVLVLDEADQMLELGFQPAITRIIGFLNPDRQTLLFSATVPPKVAQVATIAVKKDYVFLNCIPKDQQQTHAKVTQEVMIVPIESTIHGIFQQIGVEVKKNPDNYKIMIFCVAAQFTAFMADLFRATNSIATVEMHSRKSQEYRARAAKEFIQWKQVVMFTSDVSARGVDYPNVTLVLQVGTTEREAYIHRLGRTARASSGVEGRGVLITSPQEKWYVMNQIKGLPVKEIPWVEYAHDHSIPTTIHSYLQVKNEEREPKYEGVLCYQGWLGYMNSYVTKLGWTKQLLVQYANEFAKAIGATDQYGRPPLLPANTLRMMRLVGVPGLKSTSGPMHGGGDSGGGRGGRQGGFGGGRGGQAFSHGGAGGGRGRGGGGQGRVGDGGRFF